MTQAQPSARLAVVTTPERINQEWITRLADEPWVERVERIAVLNAAVEMAQRGQIDLLVIDRDLLDAETLARQIYSVAASTLCIAIVPELTTTIMRRLVLAGMRDVFGQPLAYTELAITIRTLLTAELERRKSQQAIEPSTRKRGKLVVVSSTKGGVGATTIAVNLAVALQQITSTSVALADFGLQFGDVGVHLNLWSRYTVQDLLDQSTELSETMLGRVMQPHASGIRVLLAPNEPDSAGEVTAEQIDQVLDCLLDHFSYVVVDTWSFLDEIALRFIQRADEILAVTTPEIPTLKNAKHFLGYLRKHGLSVGRITLVLNRFPSVEGISLQDVQTHLGYPIGANIPSEGRMITHSINQGTPIVLSHAKSWASESIMKLAAYVAGDSVDTVSLTPHGGRSSGQKSPVDPKTRRGWLRFVRRES
jgi:pilus assembly protein CpaE